MNNTITRFPTQRILWTRSVVLSMSILRVMQPVVTGILSFTITCGRRSSRQWIVIVMQQLHLLFFPKSFLMLPSGKLKLPSNWLIVYTVICCVNISGCYMKYASFPTFWKTHGARMFPQFLANGTRIVDSWPKWDKHHCRLRYMYESSLHCLPNQWWQWSIACMCAFTFICLHIYIYVYTFFLSHSWCLLLYWPCLMWQYRPRI